MFKTAPTARLKNPHKAQSAPPMSVKISEMRFRAPKARPAQIHSPAAAAPPAVPPPPHFTSKNSAGTHSLSYSSAMPEGTPCFEVEELYVVPEKRSRGIGEMLFRHAEEAVKAEADYMILSTATKNWKAIFHFYLDELDMTFWSARLFKKIGK